MEVNEKEKTMEKQNNWDEALENESWIAPVVDIYENEDNYFLVANMPGVKKENIKIKLEEGSLVLMGKINYEEEVNRKYVMKESESGNYFRRFKIDESIDGEKIDAQFESGQLIVTLPKHERVKPKTIEIK